MGKVLRIPAWNGNNVPQKQPEKVPLIPFGNYTATTIDISPYKWTDFESLLFNAKNTNNLTMYNPSSLDAAVVAANPTSWVCWVGYNDATTNYSILVTANGESTATVGYENAGVVCIGLLTGVRKRTVTETKQVIIPVTPDWVSSGSFVNTDEVTVNQRYTIDASKLPSDFRNADGTIKDSVKAVIQFDVNGSDHSGFANVGAIERVFNASNSTNYNTGAEVDVLPDKIAVRTAGYNVSGTNVNILAENATSNPWGLSVAITSAPCQVIVWNDEKTAISVPVGDKGLAGLSSTSVQNVGTLSTTPVQVAFDANQFTTPINATQDYITGTVGLSVSGIWNTDVAIDCTFDTSNATRTLVFEIYRVSDDITVVSKSVDILRNQVDQTIALNRLFEIPTDGLEYRLRVKAGGSDITGFFINSVQWTANLYVRN